MSDMVKESYVSFEIAKLLKEKGFNELCNGRYSYRGGNVIIENYPISNESLKYHPNIDGISAPTHQMAMKWLREVYQLHISIKPTWALGDMREPCRWEYSIISLSVATDYMYYVGENTYEEAVEAALKYALENLI